MLPHGYRNPDVEHWRNMLYRKFGCDKPSVMRLTNLSQLSPAGYREANRHIDKILKFLTSRKALGNPSAFITTGVENAHRKLNPAGEYYKGKGGYK